LRYKRRVDQQAGRDSKMLSIKEYEFRKALIWKGWLNWYLLKKIDNPNEVPSGKQILK